MAVSTISGSGSIDINEIVGKLMEVEKQPLLKLKQREAEFQAKISAYGLLLSSLTDFESAVEGLKDSDLIGLKADISDTSFFSATASSSASPGVYNIQVKNIATAQGIYSGSFASETDTVAELSTYATQKLQIQVGSGTSATITIDSSNNTLSGIRDAINNANAGVKASIINDGSGYRLVLSSGSTGASNRIMVKVDEDNNGTFEEAGAETDETGLSKLAFNATYDPDGNVTGGITNMTQSQAAVDAKLKIDGLEVTRSSNSISDLITGVTIDLKKGDNYASTTTLTVSKDNNTLKGKLDSFVSVYNKLMSHIKDLKGNIAKRGALSSDSTLTGLQNVARSVTTTTYNDTTLTLLGLTHDKNGVLSLDSAKFDSALSENEADVVETINEMASALGSSLDGYINELVPARKNGYEQTVKSIQKDQDSLILRLEIKELAFRKQFINLDKLLSQLQGTSSFLEQQIENLGKISGGK